MREDSEQITSPNMASKTGKESVIQNESSPVPETSGFKNIPLILGGVILMVLVGVGGLFAGMRLGGSKPASSPVVIEPTPLLEPTDSWQLFSNPSVAFKYPSSWVENSASGRERGVYQDFTDPVNNFTLVFSITDNFNPTTQKPYSSLDEYEGFSYQTNVLIVDGQDARQALPRAGSENINSVDFFSKDYKNIYSLELITNRDKPDKVLEGQKLFTQILSTFKFESNKEETTQTNVKIITYSPPKGWVTYTSPMGITFSYLPAYSSPTYEVTTRQLVTTDPNSVISYCTIDIRGNAADFIQFLVAPFDGGSRRQFLMSLTALPFDSSAKISTQETKLGNMSGLLIDFEQVDGSPPITFYDHTAIFIKGSVALIVHNSMINSNPQSWNNLLSSIKVDSSFSANLDNCK